MVNREYEVYDAQNTLVIRTLLRQEAKPYADKFHGYVIKRGIKVYSAQHNSNFKKEIL